MAATKICPSCGASVPSVADRCRHCFHDFSVPPKKNNALLSLLVMLAAMAVVGGGVFWYVQNRAASEKIVVDEETHSIIFTKKYSDRVETDRIRFEDVTKVEVLMGGGDATWEVAVITLDGSRKVVNQSDDKSLKGYAQQIASVMEKPLVELNEVQGFGN